MKHFLPQRRVWDPNTGCQIWYLWGGHIPTKNMLRVGTWAVQVGEIRSISPFSSIIPQQVYRTFKDWMLGFIRIIFFKHRVFNKLGGACNNICVSLFAEIIQLYRYFTTCRSCVSFFAAQTCCAGVVLKNVASIGKHREAHCIVVSIVHWDWQARPLPLVNVDGSCETILYKQKKVQLLFNKRILQQCEGNPWWNIFIYLPL